MVNGKPTWTENDPGAYARRQGHGGSAMGSFQGTVVVVPRKPKGTADAVAAKRHGRSS
jgi:hypothetical protein